MMDWNDVGKLFGILILGIALGFVLGYPIALWIGP